MSSNGRLIGVGKIRAILLVVACFLASPEGIWKAEAAAIGGDEGNGRIQIQEQDLSPNPFKHFLDQGKMGGGGGGIRSNNPNTSPEWETVLDPKLYIITEYGENSLQSQNPNQNEDSFVSETEGGSEESGFPRLRRNNNNGHSLSIVNPLDVLRQRLLLEIARRRNLKQNQHQIIANAEILKNIG